jgi:beta-mannosidase
MALPSSRSPDYQQVLQWGGIDSLPARVIYETVLPEVIKHLGADDVPYWPGSPYGGKGWDTSDPTIGDVVSASSFCSVQDVESNANPIAR